MLCNVEFVLIGPYLHSVRLAQSLAKQCLPDNTCYENQLPRPRKNIACPTQWVSVIIVSKDTSEYERLVQGDAHKYENNAGSHSLESRA